MSSSTSALAKENHATCTLVITNFMNFTSYASSEITKLKSDDKTAFQLCVDSNVQVSGSIYLTKKYTAISLYLNRSANNGKIIVQYRLSIVNSKGQRCMTQEGKIRFNVSCEFKELHSYTRDDLVNSANELLDNGKLTVYCEVYLIDTFLEKMAIQDNSIKPSSMKLDYNSLFESGKLSDVILLAAGSEFKVHKLILSTRCAVFSAMFDHDTKEKQKNRVEIEDMSAEVCREMLRYIYTDKVDNLKMHALDLMVAADRYQLEYLKNACEQHLCSNIATDSVALTLVLADMHRTVTLKSKCIEYISKNAREVKETEGWKTLADKLDLITEVLLFLSDKYRSMQ